MLTRHDLMGKEAGLNQWNNMTYEKGLIEKYLPDECIYHGTDSEGYFIASLCLYLLSGEADPATFFTAEDDLIFLEHFVFHNISKKTFLDKMSESSDEEQKIKAICDLIKSDIKLSTNIRFHDFYYNGYKSIQERNKNQKTSYCQHLLELFKRSGPDMHWVPPYNWDMFCNSCKDNNIDPSLISAPITPVMAFESLKKATAAYLKSLNDVQKKDALVEEKIALINNLTTILNNPNEDERKEKLTSFINNQANIETLSRRRYSVKGYDHAVAVFFKSLVLFLPLILDVVTFGTVKWFSQTHKSLTERAQDSLFKVKGTEIIEQVSEYIASTPSKKG